MILGISVHAYTQLHVIISLLAIASGMVCAFGLLAAKPLNGWTAFFLATTALTSLTGFGFPFHGVTPGIVVGILSLVVLAAAILARYFGHLRGAWCSTYVVTALLALYFNVFVLVVQSFEKIPALRAFAPTQSEPPFAITQIIVLVLFIVFGIFAVKRFRPEAAPATRASATATGR